MQLFQPTRDGDKQIAILSNLSESAINALDLAQLYRQRWLVATSFQSLTLNFNTTWLMKFKGAITA